MPVATCLDVGALLPSPNRSINGLLVGVPEAGCSEEGLFPGEAACRALIVSSSCCEVNGEVWVGILPRLLLGMVATEGGTTGEMLGEKLGVLEDRLGGKFRLFGRVSAWGFGAVRFCPRFGNMAISCPGILLDGAIAELFGRVGVLPKVVGGIASELLGNTGGVVVKPEPVVVSGVWGKLDAGGGGVEPSKLSAGVVSPDWGAGKVRVGEGSSAVLTSVGSAVLAVCCFCLMLLAYCQVTGKKPTANTNTAAIGAQAGKLISELLVLRVGSAITSVEYSSKAVAKSNSCNKLS